MLFPFCLLHPSLWEREIVVSKVNCFDLKPIYLFHLSLTRKYVIFSWSGRKTFVFQNKIPKMWCLRKKLSVLLSISHAWYNDVYNIAGKFVWSNSITQACFIFLLCTLMTSANESLKKKKFSIGLKNLLNNWFIRHLCIHWDMKHTGSLESTQEARVAQG